MPGRRRHTTLGAKNFLGDTDTMRMTVILATLTACLTLSACNTVSGVGRDMSSVGHAISGTAEDAKR